MAIVSAALLASATPRAMAAEAGPTVGGPLEEIVVIANGSQFELAADFAGGQVAHGGRAGFLGNPDLMDSPFSGTAYTEALIDAHDGQSVAVRWMPWYTQALSLSKPLHFGDYGRLPLKLLWALFTIATIAVLLSGL